MLFYFLLQFSKRLNDLNSILLKLHLENFLGINHSWSKSKEYEVPMYIDSCGDESPLLVG